MKCYLDGSLIFQRLHSNMLRELKNSWVCPFITLVLVLDLVVMPLYINEGFFFGSSTQTNVSLALFEE